MSSSCKTMILSKCAICGSRKSKLIKKQKARGILSSVGIRTPLSKIPLLGDILFKKIVYKNKVWRKYKNHYSTDFKSFKRCHNNTINMCCMW